MGEGAMGVSAGSDEGRGLAHGVVGPARVIAFGVSSVAPAGSVVGGLFILVSCGGFASPLVVVIAFVASLCCASSIAEFARRLPSAGSLYTYNSRGLGQVGGFLTGWMMIAAYALYAPAGVALTSAFASMLVAAVWYVTIAPWVLFVVIVAAMVLVAWLGIATSSSVDLLLAAGEVAVIAALAITILVKTGPAHYSATVFSPASSPHGQFSDITNAMIYGISAFAGFEAAAALGEEARDSRRSVPAGTIVVVIVTGLFYLLGASTKSRRTAAVGSAGGANAREWERLEALRAAGLAALLAREPQQAVTSTLPAPPLARPPTPARAATRSPPPTPGTLPTSPTDNGTETANARPSTWRTGAIGPGPALSGITRLVTVLAAFLFDHAQPGEGDVVDPTANDQRKVADRLAIEEAHLKVAPDFQFWSSGAALARRFRCPCRLPTAPG
jgi:Amino acid permease